MSEEVKEVNPTAEEEEEEYLDLLEEEMEQEARSKRIKCIIGVIVLIVIIVVGGGYIYSCKSAKYSEAVDLYNNGQYAEAAEAFESAGISDAGRMAQRSYYEDGMIALAAGDYETAKADFTAAGDYDNAADMVTKAAYKEAIATYEAGDAAAAAEMFAALNGYDQSDLYLQWCTTDAKYVGCEGESLVDAYASPRAAEAALEANVYGTWTDAEGNTLEINAATINGAAYTVAYAAGVGAYTQFAGDINAAPAEEEAAEGEAVEPETESYTYAVIPTTAGAVLYDCLTGTAYTSAEHADAVEAIAQKYTDATVANKALELYVACTEAPAVEEDNSFLGKLFALMPAHYTAKDVVVTYDENTGMYEVDLNAAYVANAAAAFKADSCPTEAVHAMYYDTSAGLELVAFAKGEDALAIDAAKAEAAAEEEAAEAEEEAAEAEEEAAPAEEEAAPAEEEAVAAEAEAPAEEAK